MAELMQQMRDPNVPQIPQNIGGNDSSLQKVLRDGSVHSTPASNLKISEQMRHAQHDSSPTIISHHKLTSSQSFTAGLNRSTSNGSISGSKTSLSSLSSLNDISPSNSQYFEVLYVGKIKVSHKRVPFTFIDDALPKFKAYDAQKLQLQMEAARRMAVKAKNDGEQGELSKINEGNEANDQNEGNEIDEGPPLPAERFRRVSPESMLIAAKPKDVPIMRDRSASIGAIPIVEQNRTMVFLIGKTDIRLISPDRKQVLLHKEFKDVASCAQGQKNAEHFGIICRDLNNEGYIGYVFKCQSEHVADEIMMAIQQAFVVCSEQKQKEKSQIFSCEHCPMLWYHKLCADIEGASDKKIQAMIFRRIETTLTEDEQKLLIEKYQGAEEAAGNSPAEQNQFLMMLLRAHCESKQQRHVHDTVENRSEFLNHYLGGSSVFMKAKRSLTSSFDHLLKRRSSKDEIGSTPVTPLPKDVSFVDGTEPKKLSPSVSRKNSDISTNPPTSQLKSPMMDIFLKVGNNPKENVNHTGSWRQAMLQNVVTPSKGLKSEEEQYLSPLRCRQPQKRQTVRHTKDQLRELWRIAIRQTIILARMEKENARLQARQSEHEIKRMKLEYDEITSCERQVSDMWDTFLESTACVKTKKDQRVLLEAVRNGVPRVKRGDVWMFLAEQYSLDTAPLDITNYPNMDTPYPTLLKNLTEHQHAIFIDLGRTFPDHKYYKDSLGVGQLSLFNLLKAYSILDPELGYCQGLGFICGVLLLHLEEADAFHMLKHLMFKREMRLKYLPDMKQFQLQLYQLSRLLKDYIPELYHWFDRHDISPTLYAAPWILTVFSSHFPLGFVTRVFDLLFLDSFDIIFSVAISLLDLHKDELLRHDNFEDIMNYLKNVLPKIDNTIMDRVFRKVFKMDIKKHLLEYQVEYNVLQEEMTSQNYHLETLNRLKEDNHQLEVQLQFAQSSLAQMDKTKQAQQSQIQILTTQVQSLENNVSILGKFVNQMLEDNPEMDLPNDVARVIQQIQNLELQGVSQQTQKKRAPMFLERKIGKSMSFNSHLGMALNVLEEANEQDVNGTPTKKKPFFEKSFEQIRQQKAGMRLQKLTPSPELNDRKMINGDDSGIATPISPQMHMHCPSTTPMTTEYNPIHSGPIMSAFKSEHPLSCGDVNFQFNTTDLKTLKPRSFMNPRQSSITSLNGGDECDRS